MTTRCLLTHKNFAPRNQFHIEFIGLVCSEHVLRWSRGTHSKWCPECACKVYRVCTHNGWVMFLVLNCYTEQPLSSIIGRFRVQISARRVLMVFLTTRTVPYPGSGSIFKRNIFPTGLVSYNSRSWNVFKWEQSIPANEGGGSRWWGVYWIAWFIYYWLLFLYMSLSVLWKAVLSYYVLL